MSLPYGPHPGRPPDRPLPPGGGGAGCLWAVPAFLLMWGLLFLPVLFLSDTEVAGWVALGVLVALPVLGVAGSVAAVAGRTAAARGSGCGLAVGCAAQVVVFVVLLVAAGALLTELWGQISPELEGLFSSYFG
ncbi:hypothetical protein [Allonocardiopsis opalescens]|uniref:Uncharacterized protein n=1 Tax=Allonocardiopsis opalescens TaxID=1144618 RepID=A0A2T0PWW6_9ACTN|nr:hypothetical protein [Allonocardiopsis opalescens]PRX96033.1 hypothetical protein CLV72_10837 [Allonocardiopsis opalescens]